MHNLGKLSHRVSSAPLVLTIWRGKQSKGLLQHGKGWRCQQLLLTENPDNRTEVKDSE